MLGALLLAIQPAVASVPEGDPFDLRWSAPEDCPDEALVREQIRASLRGLDVDDDRRVVASVDVSLLSDGSYRLSLAVGSDDEIGTREIDGGDCRALADAAALIVALAVHPDAAAPEPTEPETPAVPEPEPEPPRPAEPIAPARSQPVVSAPAAPPPERRRLASPHVQLHALAGPGFAVLPDVTGVVELAVALSGRWWRAELGGSYWTPKQVDSPVNDAVGGRFQAWGIDARGCGMPAAGAVEFPLCAGLQVGAMHGRGTGALSPARQPAALWLGLLAGAGVVWTSPVRLQLLLRAEAVVPLVRPRFGTAPSGEIFEVAPAGAQVLAGLGVRLR